MSCGVGRRHGSDWVLLWLWCDSTPSLGTSICRGGSPKKTKKKKNLSTYYMPGSVPSAGALALNKPQGMGEAHDVTDLNM